MIQKRAVLLCISVLALLSVFFLFGERLGALQSVAAVIQTQLVSKSNTEPVEETPDVVFSNETVSSLTSKEQPSNSEGLSGIAIETESTRETPISEMVVEETFSETDEPKRTVSYKFDTTALTNNIHTLSNEARGSEQISPLTFDAKLAQLAIERSTDMAKHDYLSHTSQTGCDLDCRFVQADYATMVWGENLGQYEPYRSMTPEKLAKEFVSMWLKSSEHRRNLLSSKYTHHGVGVATAGNRMVVTVIFAAPE